MRLVVIGGIAAGLSAASRARRLDPSMDILVLEKGEFISYGACGLPYYVEGRLPDWRKLQVYSKEYFHRERNIEVRTRAEVVSIAHARRRVTLSGGEQVPYDKLVIATGARGKFAIPGAGGAQVFSLNTLVEARRLREHLDTHPAGHAVIVGAGYIGLEAVEALRAHGWRVTVIDSGHDVLGRDDAELTKRIRDLLARFHVELVLGERIAAIGNGRAGSVVCDIVVVAAGLAPNVALASEGGVQIGATGAIATTEQMETNLHGVYAAGDCAEAMHLVTGRPCWIPLGTTANKMGRIAGAAAAGARERFPGVVGTSIVRICGIGFAFTGLSETQARREGFDPARASIEGRDRAGYFRGRPTTVELLGDRRSGRLLGGLVIGENGVEGRINVIATALQARMTVEQLSQLDLAYAPPFAPVWNPVLLAARALMRLVN